MNCPRHAGEESWGCPKPACIALPARGTPAQGCCSLFSALGHPSSLLHEETHLAPAPEPAPHGL